jgi:DNA-directed RNA polymerase I subunit RPA1
LGRLFTAFIQCHIAHTCGIDDLILNEKVEKERKDLLTKSASIGVDAVTDFVKNSFLDPSKASDDPVSKVSAQLRSKLLIDESSSDQLDSVVKGAMNAITSDVIRCALTPGKSGLEKPFPRNNLALMTMSGAKGSNVNQSQISCLLGQQELEGKRVPRTTAGRTLPSFLPYDPSPRAGGYIANRFLTGIRPQEYYFHCMAGREGLIDTAVKTSRSGYLQRCLVKHLENLKLAYDYTVRDDSHNAQIVQFLYGEDSIDVLKAAFIQDSDKFSFLAANYKSVLHRLNPKAASKVLNSTSVQEELSKSTPDADPIISRLSPGSNLGSVSEKFNDLLEEFLSSESNLKGVAPEKLQIMMYLKYLSSLAHPGEPVGVLTAQSIGEPSTQMTLNTFHLAGFGGANVTLGIPRLREIIMTASQNISTPLMQIYLQNDTGAEREAAEKLANGLKRVVLSEICEDTLLEEKEEQSSYSRKIFVRLGLSRKRMKDYNISLEALENRLKKSFLESLISSGEKEILSGKKLASIESEETEYPVQGDESEAEAETDVNDEKDDTPAALGEDRDSGNDDDSESSHSSVDEISGVLSPFVKKSKKSKSKTAAASKAGVYCVSIKVSKKAIEIVLSVDRSSRALFSVSSIESCCDNCVIREIKGIGNCYITQPSGPSALSDNGDYAVQTDGASFMSLWRLAFSGAFSETIDFNRIYTNDIGLVLKTYGVEAARAAIVKEIASVFSVYGIVVDNRHLFLLADYMTNEGGFRALNRVSMATSASPLLKISFETSTQFLTDAVLFGEMDSMQSVSSRIVAGRPMQSGTGAFDLVQKIEF